MKTIAPLLALLTLALPAAAVDYVTLTTANASSKVKTVLATDLVEVVGTNLNNDGNAFGLQLNFANSSSVVMALRGKEGTQFSDMKGNSFVGLNNVTLLANNGANVAVTLKITPADEIGVVAPATVLVVPEAASGDVTVEVQSSTDLVTWMPFLAKEITAGVDPSFYRLRVVKTIAPTP